MAKRITISELVIISIVLMAAFLFMFKLGTRFNPEEPQVCTIPEQKTVTFLEAELSSAFRQADHFRLQRDQLVEALNQAVDTLAICQADGDRQLCKDRNLWMRRAHECYNMSVPPELEHNCSTF